MRETRTLTRAREVSWEGKATNLQAGELVREKMVQIRQRQNGARKRRQAIAVGLSKARRAKGSDPETSPMGLR